MTSPNPAPPTRPPRRRFALWGFIAFTVLAAGAATAYWFWLRKPPEPPLPRPGDPAYEEYTETFYLGLASLDVGLYPDAEASFNRAIELVSREPAAWADRGVLYMRTNRPERAAQDLAEAEKLAPDNADIQKSLATLDELQGRLAEAGDRLRRAVEKNPQDVRALHHLARVVEREQKPNADEESLRLLNQILAVRPLNRFVLIERLKVAARVSNRAAVDDTIRRLRTLAPGWTSQHTRDAFAELEKAAAGPLGGAMVGPVLDFQIALAPEPGFSKDADEIFNVKAPPGAPLRTFVRLEPPPNSPAEADTGLAFTPEPLADVPPGRWDAAAPVWLTADGPPVVFVANAREVRRVGAGPALPSVPVAPGGLVPLDWNNDFHTDLLLAGPGGLRFYQQDANGNFTDITGKTKLPADVLNGKHTAALAADTDLDGDLDILLARQSGPPLLLRNNFDGTFTPLPIFPEVDGARAFAWADFDHDGAPDAAILDARGRLHVYANERSGLFRPWPVPVPEAVYLAITVIDADDDGTLDIAALRADGVLVRLCDRDKRAAWVVGELGRWPVPAGTEPGAVRLFAGDLDNNGVPDLLASTATGGMTWLRENHGRYTPLAGAPARVAAVTDLAGSGRLDLLALDENGRPNRHRNTGTRPYHWQTIRFRSLPWQQLAAGQGDERINSFGVGGEIELRTGTFTVTQPMTGPAAHFGLGTRTRSDIARIVWPNGTAQVELRLDADRSVAPIQRLSSSCPFLFTWNGERFVFVADFMWSTPLGMYINAQNNGGMMQTTEWVRIRGDQLVPREGHYEVRVNANLWETHYFDHLALHVIDHTPDTEVFVDERFALEPMKPTLHVTGPTRPVARAWDHLGGDATEIVRAVDGKYLDRCGRGAYQGVTNDHWVEVNLGPEAPTAGPVWLVAHGWTHPTDSSINFAIEQGSRVRPRGLVLEVPDGKGGWKVARDKIGFPAGKNKTMLLRLDGLDGPGVCRRFRLRTNMEIFWDALHYARGRPDAIIQKTELLPAAAELRYRGILEMSEANRSSPELPNYDRVTPGQPWRDLVGFHTRYGDIRELLAKVDDRYAILCAGDDVALRFAVPPGPPAGWKRDFVWVNDGWVKDGNLNTRFGKTVLPLPWHGMPNYTTPPGRLEDDPVFRRHRQDWAVYHTRYVTPTLFERGLRVK